MTYFFFTVQKINFENKACPSQYFFLNLKFHSMKGKLDLKQSHRCEYMAISVSLAICR